MKSESGWLVSARASETDTAFLGRRAISRNPHARTLADDLVGTAQRGTRMNTTGCPPGLATDESFSLDVPMCASPLSAYWVVCGAVCLARLAVAWRAAANWWALHVATDGKPAGAPGPASSASRGHCGGRRLPLVPFVHSMCFVFALVLTVAVGTGAANARNSGAWALKSLYFLSFAAWNYLSVRFLVKLGSRVAGPSRAHGPHAHARDLALERIDKPLQWAFVLQLVALLSCSLILIVLGPIFPSELVPFGVTALVLKAAFVCLAALAIAHQLGRVYASITAHERAMRDEGLAPGLAKGDARSTAAEGFAKAKRRLWVMGVTDAALYLPMIVVYLLLAGNALPWTWVWIIAVPLGTEAVGTVVVQFGVARPRRRRRDKPSETSSGKRVVAAASPLAGASNDHKSTASRTAPAS